MILAYCTDLLIGVHGAGLGWVFFMQPGTAMIEIAYPSRGWYFYYATPGYALANYPDIRVFQLEVFSVFQDTITDPDPDERSTVYKNNVWVPPDKLLQFVRDALSGEPSYYPYKIGDVYMTRTQKDDLYHLNRIASMQDDKSVIFVSYMPKGGQRMVQKMNMHDL